MFCKRRVSIATTYPQFARNWPGDALLGGTIFDISSVSSGFHGFPPRNLDELRAATAVSRVCAKRRRRAGPSSAAGRRESADRYVTEDMAKESSVTELVHEDTLVIMPPVCTRTVDAGGEDHVHYGDTPAASLESASAEERRRLAASPSTGTDVLMALADDPARSVRLALTFNPNSPMVTLLHLLSDSDRRVRSCAERAFVVRGGDPAMLERRSDTDER